MPESYIPSQDEISEAIEAGNSSMLAQYAFAIESDRQEQAKRLPHLIEEAANAKRDLDVCKAVMRNHDGTLSLLKNVMSQLRH